ncbi:MAG TPA: hypothetical protein ENJ09_01865, partial [Planctomycetes bacterium]|nr:hypothetical protein [Planctomycetota bacterium]
MDPIPDPATAPEAEEPFDPLMELAELVRRARPGSGARARLARLSEEELERLPRLYRYAASEVARLEASGGDPRRAAWARSLFALSHGLLHPGTQRRPGALVARLVHYYASRVPRAIRREWRLVGLILATLYGLAALSFVAVSRNLDLAPSLLSPSVVETEIDQLEESADGTPFRGNFTFGLRESPATAGFLMLHNIGIGVLFFAAGLIPPIFLLLLATNALMLGTYTAVAGHWGQAGAISSILWCHGVLEIQAIVLAGAAGLVLLRGWVRPGP